MKMSEVQCQFCYRLLFKLVFALSVIQMVITKSQPQVKISVVTKTQTTKANDSLTNLHDLTALLNLENSIIMEDFVQRFSNKTPQSLFFERLHDVTLSALTHIRRIRHDFFTAWFFCSRPLFIAQFFTTKNAACVNGTIEITLEQIQCDIVTSKMPWICVMCVMTLHRSQYRVTSFTDLSPC